MLYGTLTFASVFASFSLYCLWITCPRGQVLFTRLGGQIAPIIAPLARCAGTATKRERAILLNPGSLRLFEFPPDPHQDHRSHKCNHDRAHEPARVET